MYIYDLFFFSNCLICIVSNIFIFNYSVLIIFTLHRIAFLSIDSYFIYKNSKKASETKSRVLIYCWNTILFKNSQICRHKIPIFFRSSILLSYLIHNNHDNTRSQLRISSSRKPFPLIVKFRQLAIKLT